MASLLACAQSPDSTVPDPDVPTAPTTPPIASVVPPVSDESSFYLELGGSYSILNGDNAPWKELSAKLGYSGLKKWFTPFVTFSSQDRGAGSQQNYGVYSYVTLSKRIWATPGISFAPVRSAVLYPQLRVGGTVFLGVFPRMPALFVSVGVSDIHMPGGTGGGEIFSIGAIHYGKVILSGNVNINRDGTSGFISESGQAGFQYGRQGRFWIGGGASGGDAAYQIIGLVPLNVHFNSVGANVFYQCWLTRKFGVIIRYDYLDEINFFRKNGAYVGTFFEF
jgi:YaiO family outer membrane protein